MNFMQKFAAELNTPLFILQFDDALALSARLSAGSGSAPGYPRRIQRNAQLIRRCG